jgi:hypothetical protein
MVRAAPEFIVLGHNLLRTKKMINLMAMKPIWQVSLADHWTSCVERIVGMISQRRDLETKSKRSQFRGIKSAVWEGRFYNNILCIQPWTHCPQVMLPANLRPFGHVYHRQETYAIFL